MISDVLANNITNSKSRRGGGALFNQRNVERNDSKTKLGLESIQINTCLVIVVSYYYI